MRRAARALAFLLFASVAFTGPTGPAEADCRGCCSRHDGVVCNNGTTRCGDGSPLSTKCREKKCSKCTDESQEATRPQTPYNRKDWPHWIDEDGDCQNTRSEILQRDNIGTIKWKRNKPCNVSWGKWVCPYTGKVFTKASDMDIDHIVPLGHAHRTGGANWSREKKRQFANDPMNLLAVEDNANQAKSDKAPDEWKPPKREYWKE
ncbi:MAG: HNH endonuclease, partial [Deltaproteobacteria bacterium]|nr:HNH endonuclease [Deltaproteobacteria bacterium]